MHGRLLLEILKTPAGAFNEMGCYFDDLYTQKRDGCSFISAFILIAIILVYKRVKEKNCGLGVLACVIFLPLIDINAWVRMWRVV